MDLNHLKDYGTKPNWVSTLTKDDLHRMNPWPMLGSVAATKSHIKNKLKAFRGAKLVKEEDNALHYEFTTLIFRFVDDVVFVFEPKTNLVHFSSRSRVGYSDLGANRKRMETIADQYAAR